MIKVAIIEDHRLARLGIEQALSGSADMRVVASVSEADQLDLAADPPDVVILDPSPYQGEESFRLVQAVSERCLVLVVSASTEPIDPADALAAIRAGAYGVITRQADNDELRLAVRAVAAAGFYLSAGLAPHLQRELGRRTGLDSHGLAPREMETLRWVARGYTHGQIGRRMGLTEATVNTYVKSIRAKLNVRNKAELTRKAIELGCLGREIGAKAAEVIRPDAWRPRHRGLGVARENSA
jgi:DNA-binding NarL/FixJ family response regulator